MSFFNRMYANEKSYTENGAMGYAHTIHPLTELNFTVPSMRNNGINRDLFERALDEDKNLTLRWLLYLRDITEGIGERKSFRDFIISLVKSNPKLAKKFLSAVPVEDYGRFDDYVAIYSHINNVAIKNVIGKKLTKQLYSDIDNMDAGKPVSLLAKWLPSENTSSKVTKAMAAQMRNVFGMVPRQYRKILSRLRKYLKVVEVDMSANNWGEIDYQRVPSVANSIYRNAFLSHDTERRQAYLDKLSKGEAKINANSMFLHDIVKNYDLRKGEDATLEAMWKAQKPVEGFTDTLVVRDGSGSMTCGGVNGVTALTIADAITLYCAEQNKGAYHNKFVTFSARPKCIDVSRYKTLCDKLKALHREGDCTNTNLEAVFDLVLDTAVKGKLSQEELPKSILVISDMEFDEATSGIHTDTLFENIGRKYQQYGYKLPKLVFWNVESRTNTIPINQNENGVILLSGFNKALLNMVMSSQLDPFKALVEVLSVPRYDVINQVTD